VVTAVAVAIRSPKAPAIDSSPIKSPADSSVILASLPEFRYNRDFRPAALEIKDTVGGTSLRKELRARLEMHDSTSQPCIGKESSGVEGKDVREGHFEIVPGAPINPTVG
jgi:hypothetical protein